MMPLMIFESGTGTAADGLPGTLTDNPRRRVAGGAPLTGRRVTGKFCQAAAGAAANPLPAEERPSPCTVTDGPEIGLSAGNFRRESHRDGVNFGTGPPDW
jgi:hypothetical protein